MEIQNSLNSQNLILNKNKAEFKTYYKAVIIKAVWHQQNDNIDQWNRTEGPK